MKKLYSAVVLLLCMSIAGTVFGAEKKADKHKKKSSKAAAAVVVPVVENNVVVKEPAALEAEEKTTDAAVKPDQFANKPYLVVNDDFSNLLGADPSKPVYDLLSIKERQAKGLPTALPEIQPYQEGKVAYLTFDDGPEGKNTPAILDVLKNEGVKGTFYVVGSQCYSYPENLLRMFTEGHAIGNHSYSHDYDVLYPNVYGFLEEMYQTEAACRAILGFRPLIIRAPGGTWGNFTSDYPYALKEAGLVNHNWNVCIDDAVGGHPTAADFVEKVRQQTADGKSCAIVLMHCSYGKEETVKALPEIIHLLHARGYSFGVVTPATPRM